MQQLLYRSLKDSTRGVGISVSKQKEEATLKGD
jgi:hypothetical protein